MPYPPSRFSNPYLNMLGIAWTYAGNQWPRFALVYTMFMFSNLMQVFYPILWGLFINQVQQDGTGVLKWAWAYAGVYVLVRLSDWCCHGPARILEQELAFDISRNFLQELYHKALHLPVQWHQDNHSGATINRIRKAYEAMKLFFRQGFEYLHTFFKFVFSFAAMIYFSPLFGMVATILGILVVWIILIFDKPFIRTLEQVNEEEHKASSTLFDSLSNIVTVITLRLEQRMEAGLMHKIGAILAPYRRNIRINEWKWFIVDMLVGIIYATILVGYVWQNWTAGQTFQLGGLVMLMGYVERFTSVFHNVAYLYTDVVQQNTDVTTAFKIIDAYEQKHTPEQTSVLPPLWKTIDIADLSFAHRELDRADRPSGIHVAVRDRHATGLHQITIRLERGKRIALIGESGSGKSTLLAVLRGLHQPQYGCRVSVDGQLQSSFDMIASHVTLFPQEPEIFESTIEYNITLGLPHDPNEIETICQRVGFWDVVQQLPKGLQSSIQEKGVNLSGGQKQRLALARGVFAAKDSDIVLLDEPTSSIDPKTESRIYDQLFADFKDKAVVSALHRLHLLPRFDHIYLLGNGRVIEHGSFEDLSANSHAFQEMWEHQHQGH
jgi:ABC-type multidrug transport system fused ATPase/permease subunit